MTTIEQAFLADIAAQPQDDFPRLAYADWLEEHGQSERAEFIRVQCELARQDFRCTCTCEYEHGIGCLAARGEKLRRREEELLGIHFDQWRALPGLAGKEFTLDSIFRRGFISRITLPCAAFLQHAADIIEAVPMLEDVRLSDVGPMELHFNDGPSVWVFSRASAWPAAFDDAVNLTHDNRENALSIMSRCCLQFAREQLAARRKRAPLASLGIAVGDVVKDL